VYGMRPLPPLRRDEPHPHPLNNAVYRLLRCG
jgi:hypothetical protein